VVQHTAAENPLRSVHESVFAPILQVKLIPKLKVESKLSIRLGSCLSMC